MENIELIIPLLSFQTCLILVGITFVIYYKCFNIKIRNITLL